VIVLSLRRRDKTSQWRIASGLNPQVIHTVDN
jgi:hypothetical protein